jgi:hypothetical protein
MSIRTMLSSLLDGTAVEQKASVIARDVCLSASRSAAYLTKKIVCGSAQGHCSGSMSSSRLRGRHIWAK